MGLAALLNRSSPNVGSAARGVGPALGPTQFMAGPEQTWPPSSVLPPPSESDALSVPAFWRGCAYTCGTVGMLPRYVYRGTDVVDPQPPVVVQPDPNQTPMAYWTGQAESLTLYGNAINIITATDRNGWPTTLKPIHPTLAAVRFTGNPMAPTIAAWYVAGQIYDPSEIWHVKSHLGRAGWPLGRGLIDTDSDAIAMALALQSYGAGYFNSGGMPIGVLKVHRPEVTQEQADQAKTQWISKYAGTPGVAVLNELTDFTPVAFNPVDSQMIESRQFSLVEVALMWGVPPSKLGASVGGGTYRNAEMEEVQARNDAVAPWTRLLEEAASLELVPRGQHVEWNLSASLRTDTLSLYQAYQAALGGPGPQSLWMLPDEIRAKENMDPMAIVADEINDQVKAAGVDLLPGMAAVAGMPATAPPAPAPSPAPAPAPGSPAMPRVGGGPATPNSTPEPNPPVSPPMMHPNQTVGSGASAAGPNGKGG
jgi:HK97 family phage portal protein